MTEQIKALLFPDTRPADADLSLLRTVYDPLRWYALPPEIPQGNDSGGYIPVALSEDEQNRFCHLLKDIKGHEGEFYASQLAALATGRTDRQEAAAWSLVASIRTGATPAAVAANEQETVWQALLLLRLAEMLREEEAEIASGLAAVAGLEDELLSELKGEDDLDEEDASEFRALAGGAPMSGSALDPRRLCKAWGTLYLRDRRAQEAMVLATAHEEVAGLLADLCETHTGQPPSTLCALELPITASPEISNLQEALSELRQTLNPLLQEAAATDQLPPDLLARLGQTEEKMKRAILPFQEDSPLVRPLTLYALRGTSFPRLFASLCKPGRETPPTDPATTALLAVLGKPRAQR